MKNVNIEQLRIPAYTVLNMDTNFAHSIALNRGDARSDLQSLKKEYPTCHFKIIKMKAEKFIR